MKGFLVSFLVVASAFVGVNCATIVHGTTQDVPVTSEPSGVHVIINGVARGVTPLVLTLKRGMNHQIVFRRDGSKDVVVNLEKEFKGGTAIVGNLFSWSLLGILVDVANGAAYSLSPEDVHVNIGERDITSGIPTNSDMRVVVMSKEQYGSSRRNAELLASILESNSLADHARELPSVYRSCRYVTAIWEGRWASAVVVNGDLKVVVLPDAKSEAEAHRATKKQIDRYLEG